MFQQTASSAETLCIINFVVSFLSAELRIHWVFLYEALKMEKPYD